MSERLLEPLWGELPDSPPVKASGLSCDRCSDIITFTIDAIVATGWGEDELEMHPELNWQAIGGG